MQGSGPGCQESGWRCHTPRGTWEGIFHWLQARVPHTRRPKGRMVVLSEGRKLLSWEVGAWSVRLLTDHQHGLLTGPRGHREQAGRGVVGGRQSQLPAG